MSDGIDIETSLRRIAQEEALKVAGPLRDELEAAKSQLRSLRAKAEAKPKVASGLLTKAEVARLIGKSPRTVQRMVNSRQLHAPIDVKGFPRWKSCWLEKWTSE